MGKTLPPHLSERDLVKDCWNCNGTGVIVKHFSFEDGVDERECGACHGTGWVWDVEKAARKPDPLWLMVSDFHTGGELFCKAIKEGKYLYQTERDHKPFIEPVGPIPYPKYLLGYDPVLQPYKPPTVFKMHDEFGPIEHIRKIHEEEE